MRHEKPFDIFLSYTSKDSKWVQTLKEALEKRGVDVWVDKNEIRPGDQYANALEKGIEGSRSVGLVVTPESLSSSWVQEEYYRALDLASAKQLQLIPLLLRETEMPGFLAGRSYVDFRDADRFDFAVDKPIWPGVTGQRIYSYIALTYDPQTVWDRRPFREFGITSGGWSGFGRIQEAINAQGGGYSHPFLSGQFGDRFAIFVDLFGAHPDRSRGLIYELFGIRDRTRETDFEPVFVLYHDSHALDAARGALDSETVFRLGHYHTIHSDLDDQELRLELRRVWNAVQKDFMLADHLVQRRART